MPTFLLVLIMYPVMSVQFAVTKLGNEAGLSAIDIAGLRYLGAAILGAPLFLRSDVRETFARHPFRMLLLGTLGGGLYGTVFAVATSLTPSTHGAILLPSTNITATLIGAGLMNGVWPDRVRWIGLALIVGGLIVFGVGSRGGLGGGGALTIYGDMMFVSLGLMWAVVSLLMRRWNVPPAATTASLVVTGLFAVAFWIAVEGVSAARAAPLASLGQALFQGGLLTVIAFAVWGELVARLGPALTSLGVACVPLLATLVAIPLLGEWPSTLQYLATGIVVAGMALASGAAQHYLRWR
jgi:drug/metabolite transporter (DMT)-like permease